MILITHRRLALSFFCIGMLLLLTGCSVFGMGSPATTATPEPTSSIPNLQVVPPQACKVAEQGLIRVYEPQGDLIAWSPNSDTVAYIASTQGSSWNVGDLNILSAPLFADPKRLATGTAGELTWSPDSSIIAFLGLRKSDELYTIGLAYPDERPSQDLFADEVARTDDYSSQKAVLEWIDTDRLRVLASCGLDCMQTIDFNVQSGLSSPVGDPILRKWGMWEPRTNQPASLPSEFADLPGQLNWSPDEKYIAYVDQVGNAWVIHSQDGSLYPLDIGQYGTATETDWSFDSQYLALQVDQNMLIFSLKCP